MPVSGSLQAYSTEYIGPANGFHDRLGKLDRRRSNDYSPNSCCCYYHERYHSKQPDLAVDRCLCGSFAWRKSARCKTFGDISFDVSSLKIILVIVFVIIGVAMMMGLCWFRSRRFQSVYF